MLCVVNVLQVVIQGDVSYDLPELLIEQFNVSYIKLVIVYNITVILQI